MPDLQVQLINLDGSDDRLRSATDQLTAEGIAFQRFAAFDGRGTQATDYPEYRALSARFWYGRRLNGGEIGCFYSHLLCMRAFMKTDAQELLIIEDDVELSPGFGETLTEIREILNSGAAGDWYALNLGTIIGKAVVSKYRSPIQTLAGSGGDIDLCHAHLFPLNTHCILWSRDGVAAFLDQFKTIWTPVDHAFRHFLVRQGMGLCLTRAIALQSDAPSVIDSGGTSVARDQRESAWYWFHVWRIKRLERIYAKRFRRQRMLIQG